MNMHKIAPSSVFPGFYRLPVDQRRAAVAERFPLDPGFAEVLAVDAADQMVENAIGVFGLPLGLCVNMVVDGCDRVIPMAIEEPSVVAACCHMAKLLRKGGGVTTEVSPSHMIGQIQVLDVADAAAAESAVLAARGRLLEAANSNSDTLVHLGGGAIDIEVRHLPPLDADDPVGPMLVVHLVVNVLDAMGANAVNRMCEALAPEIEALTGGRVRLRILSNLSDRRTVVATCRVPIHALPTHGGSPEWVAQGIVEASVFAERDPYRASTHNKGIMNGVDAVLIAFGQDWRAVEAGAHAYAARNGRYGPLATWRRCGDYLEGRLEIPMAVGSVGGVVRVHPTVKSCLRLAGVDGAADMASLVAALGLAQNLAALRALADEGINRGHLRLHARNIAAEAGATAEEVQLVAERIADDGKVSLATATAALREIQGQ
jgi:hydroxymethylglutaryl-CoA reductase